MPGDSLTLTGKGRISPGISANMQQARIGLNQGAGEFCAVEDHTQMKRVGRQPCHSEGFLLGGRASTV